MTGSQAAAPVWSALRLRIGETIVAASDVAAVDAAIAASNQAKAIDGLADALNPSIIDAAKAHAFLAALVKLPAAQFRRLSGHALYLNSPDLPIRATSPATVASFATLRGLRKPDVQGDIVLVGVLMQLDCALALRQAAGARDALAAIGPEIEKQRTVRAASNGEAETRALRVLSGLVQRRSAMAMAWVENATAARACTPNDAAARKDLAAAKQASSDFVVP